MLLNIFEHLIFNYKFTNKTMNLKIPIFVNLVIYNNLSFEFIILKIISIIKLIKYKFKYIGGFLHNFKLQLRIQITCVLFIVIV